MGSKVNNVAEIERRIRALGERARATEQARVDPTVRIRRLEPGVRQMLRARCVRCGGTIEGEPHRTPAGVWHEHCAPAPAPAPAIAECPGEAVVRDTRPHTSGIRRTHLPASERVRALAWLAENGPATARTVAWALDLDHREVALLLRSLEGVDVEPVGVLMTGRRGHPPTVWRVTRRAAAA